MQNAVDVKRIVTRLALFQLSEGRSWSSNGSHKAINYSGTPLMWSPLGYKILIVIMGWSLEWAIFKTIKKKSAISTFVWREYGLQRGGRMPGLQYVGIKSLSNLGL